MSSSKEEAKKLYEGKYFYEIVDAGEAGVNLVGPLDNIYFAVTQEGHPSPYKFVEVIDGKPTRAFTENEILLTTLKITGVRNVA